MRFLGSCSFVLLLLAPALVSADVYKVEPIKDAPPAGVAPEIASGLNGQGYRVTDDQGKPFAEIWLRKAIPAKAKPAGANGAIQFPFLAEGELLGVLHLVGEAHDYRDQTIDKGVYTMRYGLQPVNGDHLGVSPFRDYTLLLPAAKDKAVASLPRKQLEAQSSEAAGTSHPAVFFMLSAPANAPASMIHDEAKNTWRVALPLSLTAPGESQPIPHPVSFILSGVSEGA
ncbi:MAG: hypothetical protein P4L85_13495 [Paludisphaera borealis]|uniref:hypothetical protein n=1 Tax=Paludisphaera borealis TaxID=1387353 RepID=UPI00283DED06|nr:hypothetical protein [Paludisphaera borealis]MDR3620359.1 hypothetical protein [Paludisphaera borealis]